MKRPVIDARELFWLYQLVPIGTLDVRESWVAVTLDRRRLHPAVQTMLDAAAP